MFTSFRDLIDAWPNLREFGSDIGVGENTAKGMRRRDSIHSAYWDDVVTGARCRDIDGVSLELLSQLAKARGRRAA
ncbi:hypothetical protein [Filomicrobium insigne]|uniref:hypothetical protein n=1 Tax=Filomicrobium insigne TaxID=418854 RepID=UPI000B7F3B37|nr:hypothetical protein [Filomicrobium insigne]